MNQKIFTHLSTILIWLYVFFAPTFVFISFIGILVVADTFGGIRAAKKLGTLDNKISKRIRPAIDKFIQYAIGILIAHVMQYLFMPDFQAMKLVAGLIISIELKSFDENFTIITGFSIFKFVQKKLKIK